MAGTPRVSVYLGTGARAKALHARVEAAGTSLSSYICDALELVAAAADAGFFLGPGGQLLCRPGAAGSLEAAIAAMPVAAAAPSPTPPARPRKGPSARQEPAQAAQSTPPSPQGVRPAPAPGSGDEPGAAEVAPLAANAADGPATETAGARDGWPELGTLLQGWD